MTATTTKAKSTKAKAAKAIPAPHPGYPVISVLQMIALIVARKGVGMFSVLFDDPDCSSLRKGATDGSGAVNAYYHNTRKLTAYNLMWIRL